MENIGVFDSGIGGLTVARSIFDLKIAKRLIYFGDLAHMPYGDKSEAAIQAYSLRIAEFLVAKGCDTLVIACNSASASATELLKEYLDRKIKIINVVQPMTEYVHRHYDGKNVGLIGTKRTVQSGIYLSELQKMGSAVQLNALATPLLVPVIEENVFSETLRKQILFEYLDTGKMKTVDALILGCTHYPLIKPQVHEYFHDQVPILDSSEIMGEYLQKESDSNETFDTQISFYVSDITDFFREAAERFFGSAIELQVHTMNHIL